MAINGIPEGFELVEEEVDTKVDIPEGFELVQDEEQEINIPEGFELVEEEQPPVEEKKDPLSNIEQLENQLIELKSKKEKTQPGQEKYDLGMSIKRLEDQIDEAKEKMFYGEPDINNSFTLVDQTEDTFKRVMNEANIPVEFTGTIGNEIKYIDPITRETKKIDLRPFGYQNKLKVARQIDELKDSFKKLSSEEAFKNTVSTIDIIMGEVGKEYFETYSSIISSSEKMMMIIIIIIYIFC